MLKNIIFDWGNVISVYDRDRILSAFWEDPADRARLTAILHRDWEGLDHGTTDYAEYARETLDLVPAEDRSKVSEFFRDWYKPKAFPPIEDTWALIARLKARGYRTYVLSNAPTEFAENLDIFPITRLMDGTIVSGAVRMHKPNADIFRLALDRFGITAEETLFVDDIPVNTQGAATVGMDTYVFDGDVSKLLAYIEEHSV